MNVSAINYDKIVHSRTLIAIASVSALVATAFLFSLWASASWGTDTSSWLTVAVFFFIGVSALWLHRTPAHPYIFFIGTAAMFLGGRLLAHATGWSAPVFVETGFIPIDLGREDAHRLVVLFLSSILAIHAGYVAFFALSGRNPVDRPAPSPTPWQETLVIPAAILICASAPLAVYGAWSHLQTCLDEGYLGIYATQADPATRLGSIAQYLLLLGVGCALASGNRVCQAAGLLVMTVVSILTFAVGIRSGLLSFAMLLAWITQKHFARLGLITVLVLPALLVVLAQGAQNFSCRVTVPSAGYTTSGQGPDVSDRGSTREETTVREKISALANDLRIPAVQAMVFGQGSSLLSISVADSIDEYPWPAYVQTFFPGFGLIMKATGNELPASDLYFGQHMAKEWMPERYERGEGFGWSIVSDFLVFSNGSNLAFALLAVSFGAGFAVLVSYAGSNAVWFGALAVIVPKIVLLPRAGLYSIFPYLIAFGVIVAAWWIFTSMLGKLRRRYSA